MKGRVILVVFYFLISGNTVTGLTVGKYAGDFMAVGVGARALALGGAFTAVADDISAGYWNPAGLSRLSHVQVMMMHAERFGGIVNWDFMGVGLPLRGESAVALGLYRLGIDGIPLTRLRDPKREMGDIYFDESGRRLQNVPYAYKYTSPNDLALVGSYSSKLDDKIRIGLNARLIRRSADVYEAWGMGFDAGILVHLENRWQVGAMIRDATGTLLAWNGGRKEWILPRLQVGVGYPFQARSFSFLPILDVAIHFDNTVQTTFKMGRVSMEIMGGLEICYQNRIALRFGSNRGALTAGTGFRIAFFSVDYGFQTHSELGLTHRVSLTITDIRDKLSQNR
ncbi:MAG TPA: PorV/PorQ family protein [bacterium]|nr:PorV/PorQ family protein [bacterium]